MPYHHLLDVVKSETEVTQELVDAVNYLMYWKLGKVSSIAKAREQEHIKGGVKFSDNKMTFNKLISSITGT